jgi:tetratricopeptide (TPR) repeat protein
MQLRSSTFFSIVVMAALASSTSIDAALADPEQSGGMYRNQIAYASTPPCTTDLQAARLVATTFFQAEDYRDSMLMYQTICRQPTATAEDFRLLGESHFRQKAYTRAAQCFTRTIQLDPKSDAVRVRLVEAYLAGKDKPHAQQACVSALSAVTDVYSRGQLETLQKLLSQPDLQSLLSGCSSGRTFASRGPQG